MYVTTKCQSPLGMLTLASDGANLTGLWIEGQKYFADTLPGETEERDDLPLFDAARDWLGRYFAGKKPAPDELPLRPAGSEYRRAVWQILCRIPYGQITSYGRIASEMAARLGRTTISGQAVGGAVSHNPIAIIIPCHRVVGADGSLTGYAGGIANKIALLRLEGVDLSRLYVPRTGTAL